MLRGTNSLNKLIDDKSAEQVKLVEAIKSGSEDMVMVMGLGIYELSTLLAPSAFDDLEQLREQILARTLDQNFLSRWDEFIDQFGCRGPLEMDLAQPKYADDPLVVLRQVATVAKSNQTFDPRINHQKLKDNRDKAYLELKGLLPAKKQAKLASAYKHICDFEHSREIPKDHLVSIQKRVREYLIQQAETWVVEGRLNSIEQVFDLKVAEIINARQHEDVSPG